MQNIYFLITNLADQ